MRVEDNCYDFKVSDRLQRECRERNWELQNDPEDHKAMVDMITYCSRGNEEEAVLNLKTSKEFMDNFQRTFRIMGMTFWDYSLGVNRVMAESVLFQFWKKSFIELKVAVHKNEIISHESYHEALMRGLGRFLNEENFNNLDAFKSEVRTVENTLVATTNNFNNIFKNLMKKEKHN